MALPLITPANPTLIPRPVHHSDWIYEEKVDGYRMLAYKEGQSVRLVSRGGTDFTRRFPSIVAALCMQH